MRSSSCIQENTFPQLLAIYKYLPWGVHQRGKLTDQASNQETSGSFKLTHWKYISYRCCTTLATFFKCWSWKFLFLLKRKSRLRYSDFWSRCRAQVSGELRVVLAACSNICACVKLLVDGIFVIAESWPDALAREIFLHTYSTVRNGQPTKMTLARQRGLSSSMVRASDLEHGVSWVRISSGAQIFSVLSYGWFLTSTFISFKTKWAI